MQLLSADGIKNIIESSTDFKTAMSPIVYDDYRFGECYDVNLEIEGWNLVEFDDGTSKTPVKSGVYKVHN